MANTKNIKYGSGKPTSDAEGKPLKVAKYSDPRSRKGLYYGTDGLKKIKLPDGTIRWVESNVHPTKT